MSIIVFCEFAVPYNVDTRDIGDGAFFCGMGRGEGKNPQCSPGRGGVVRGSKKKFVGIIKWGIKSQSWNL